ncbi:MAG: penicillin-binding protein 1C [Vulcanimicrobiaceae bacterium]
MGLAQPPRAASAQAAKKPTRTIRRQQTCIERLQQTTASQAFNGLPEEYLRGSNLERIVRPYAFWLVLGTVGLGLVLLGRALCVPASLLAPRDTSIAFLDRTGIPLGTVLSPDQTHTSAVPLAKVSPQFVRAILAVEDARYFEHGAVDWLALTRAGVQTLRCLCIESGASTIAMQLARMQFGIPHTFAGKLLQMWDATRIEAGVDKVTILQDYVNRVTMGENIYGVDAAARSYFGIPASDLDLAQAALLAGIPNDPTGLDPRSHWAAARARARYVLARMVATGSATAAQAAIAMREEIHLRPLGDGPIAAQQLLFRIARERPDLPSPVRTTIDLRLQRFVQSQARQVVGALSGRNVTQAAALVIDNRNGEVLAYLGSTDYFNDAYLGRNDGVRALRQPGSTLKPFLYEFALERRAIRPNTILADVPTSYAIPNGEIYSPQDYSRQFSGPVPVRFALANSLNVPAVRVLARVGVTAFLTRLHQLGFAHLTHPPAYYGLGLTLGAGDVTLWDLAHAYVTLARGGDAIPLRTVRGGGPVRGTQIGDRGTWELITSMLSDPYARAQSFGIGSVVDLPFPAAVKTGTSSGFRDTWTVGYTPQYTVAVWVGNFTGAPMRDVAGVSGAGPLWNRIMLHLYERRDPPPLPAPQGYARVALCATTGLPPARDCRHVYSEYLDAGDLRAMLLAERRPRSAARQAAYDRWRAQQGETTGPLHILFPQDGAAFEDALAPNDPRRAQQTVEFRISRPRGALVTWSLDGRRIARGGGDRYFWTVRPGAWVLTVASGRAVRRVRFEVIRGRPHAKRGFALSSR